jgi:hypothetical protein
MRILISVPKLLLGCLAAANYAQQHLPHWEILNSRPITRR